MPKTKGMTSIEIAIIVAIVLIIAVAVGWYLYTTFTASTQAQARLNIASATYYTSGTDANKVALTVTNPGPVEVTIQTVYLSGQQCSNLEASDAGFTVESGKVKVAVGATGTVKATCTGISATPGTSLSGQVVTTAGTSFPFTASVR